MKLLKQSTAITVLIGPFVDKTDGVIEESGLAGTGSELSKAGGSFAAGPTLGTHDSDGWYPLALTTTHTNTLGELVIKVHDNATHLPVWERYMVVPANIYDSLVGGSDVLDVSTIQFNGSAVTQSGGRPEVNTSHIAGSAVSTSTAQIGVNVVNAGGTAWGSGAITAAAIASGAITSAKFAASAIDATAIATGAITSAKFAAGAIDAAAIATGAIDADALATDAVTEIRSIVSGTADSGTTTTMVDAALTQADTDYWKGKFILFTSGTISGQCRLITGFTPGTDTITFAPATTQAVGTNTYEILANARVDVELWDGSAVNSLVSGRVDASVGAMDANVVTAATIAAGAITSAKFAAGAIDAAAIAADAIGASELAADAVAEIADAVWDEARAGHVAAGSFGEGVASVQGNVTGSVASVTGAVGSVTGNVGGNVVGSVASVTGNVAGNVTGTIGGLTAAALADFFDTNSGTTYASAVAGSVVKEIADNAGGSALTEAGIADAVWDEARAGHVAAGSFGEGIASVQGNVTGSVGSVTGAVGSVTGNVGGNVTGSVGSLGATAKTDVNAEVDTALADYGALKPTVAGRTLDVTATGEAGIDWANIGSPTTVQGLSGTTIKTATDVETDTADIQSRLPAALVGGRIDASVGAMATAVVTATAIAADAIGASELAADAVAEIADAVWDEVLAGHLTAGTTGAALNSAGAAGDPWSTAIPGAYGAGSAGYIVGNNLNAAVANVEADTQDIQTRLPAALVSGRMDSSVGAMAAAVVTAAAIATDAIDADALAADAVTEIQSGLATSANQTTILNRLGAWTGTGVNTLLGAFKALLNKASSAPSDIGGTFDPAADSTEAIRDRGDAAWTTATGFSTLDAAGVRSAVGLASANMDTQFSGIQSDTNDLQTRVPAALVGGRIDANVSAINNNTGNVGRLDRSARSIVLGTVTAGATTTSIPTSSLDPAAGVTDQFKGRIVIFDKDTTTANLRGQATDITASTAGGTLTVTALTTAPASGDTFVIV